MSERTDIQGIMIQLHFRSFSQCNVDHFLCFLRSENYKCVLQCLDCQSANSGFHTIIRRFENCFPIKEQKSEYKSRKEWLTPAPCESIETKTQMYIYSMKYLSEDNSNVYIQHQNKLHCFMHHADHQLRFNFFKSANLTPRDLGLYIY